MNFIRNNIKPIVAGLAALFIIVFGAVALSLAFGGRTVRSVTVVDINGSAMIIRGTKQTYASKRSVLSSGDVINTAENSTVRIRVDDGKYIAVEPESSVYIYYTGISGSGDVSVNVAAGAVTCQLDKPLGKNETFVVKTPNTAVNVRGTVFRTEFSFRENYMGAENVMLTHVQNFDGSVLLQLYSEEGEKVDEPMLLTERTSAELITGHGVAKYGYLNYDTDMYALNDIAINELIRICGERPIAYSLDELNSALRASKQRASSMSVSAAESAAESEAALTAETSVTEPPVSETAVPETTAPTETTAEETTTYGTLRTTAKSYEFTTFAGPKWWEMPNENPYADDDEFDDGGVFASPQQ